MGFKKKQNLTIVRSRNESKEIHVKCQTELSDGPVPFELVANS